MGRQVLLDDLVSAHEIALRLRFSQVPSFHRMRRRDLTFPAPVRRVGAEGRLWLWAWSDLATWPSIDAYGIKPSQPLAGCLIDVDDLVSNYEIKVRTGFSTSSNLYRRQKNDSLFPEPLIRVGKHGYFPIWQWDDVLRWAYRAGKLAPARHRIP